jgi:hypothetical protein
VWWLRLGCRADPAHWWRYGRVRAGLDSRREVALVLYNSLLFRLNQACQWVHNTFETSETWCPCAPVAVSNPSCQAARAAAAASARGAQAAPLSFPPRLPSSIPAYLPPGAAPPPEPLSAQHRAILKCSSASAFGPPLHLGPRRPVPQVCRNPRPSRRFLLAGAGGKSLLKSLRNAPLASASSSS